MSGEEHKRRDILQAITMLPLLGSVIGSGQARAQTAGTPVKVDTKGLVAKIKFEAPLGGFLTEINGKYKLRVTELTLAPGGHVGEHNHVGPGIRQVTSGYMTHVLPTETIVYGPGEVLFRDRRHQSHRLQQDRCTDGACAVRDLARRPRGASLIPVK